MASVMLESEMQESEMQEMQRMLQEQRQMQRMLQEQQQMQRMQQKTNMAKEELMTSHILSSVEVEGKISSGKDDEQGAEGGGLDRNITFKAYAQDGLQTKASSKAELSPATTASMTPVSPPFKTKAWNDGGVVPATPLTAPTPEAATQDAFTPVPGTVKSKVHAFTTLARPDSPRPLQTVTPVPTQSAAIDPGSDGEARVVYMPATAATGDATPPGGSSKVYDVTGKPTTQSDPMWTPRFSAPTSPKEGFADERNKTAASDPPNVAAAALPTAVAAAETALAFFAEKDMYRQEVVDLQRQHKMWDLQLSLSLQAQHQHQMQVMEMEAASLSLEHGLDGVDSAPLPSPPPHPQLAVSPPQGKLDLPMRSPVPARLGDDVTAVDEDKFLAMQQQLEAARKRIDELVAQQYQTRVETTEVPVTYPQPQIVEKVVEKFVEVPVEKIIERVVEIPVYKEKIVERLVTKEVEVEKMVYEEKVFDKVIEVPPNYAAIETTLLASNAAMLDSTAVDSMRSLRTSSSRSSIAASAAEKLEQQQRRSVAPPTGPDQVGLGLGIEMDDRGDVYIAEIIPGYGAYAAGKALQPYDIIRAVDGRSVLKQALKTINSYTVGPVGSACVLRIARGGHMYDIVVQRIDPEGLAGANLVRSSFRDADEDKIYAKLHHPATEKRLVSLGFGASVNREGQVVIAELVPGFAADQSQAIVVGDILLGVDGVNIQGLSMQAIAERTLGREGSACVLSLRRDGLEFDVECRRVTPAVDMHADNSADRVEREEIMKTKAGMGQNDEPSTQNGEQESPSAWYADFYGGRTSADKALMTMKEFYGNKVGEELLTHAAPTFVDPGLVQA